MKKLSSHRRRLTSLAARDGAHCVWCRVTLDPCDRLATADHLVPNSISKTSYKGNLVLACRTCNKERADLPVAVYLRRCVAQDADPDLGALRRALAMTASAALPFSRSAGEQLAAVERTIRSSLAFAAV